MRSNQKGQAIFELILFVPIFLYMIKILFDYGDAVNNSINQLKAVRGYYYYSLQNDSYVPNLSFQTAYHESQTGTIGLDAFSWSLLNVADAGGGPKGSCVRVLNFFGNRIDGDACLTPVADEGKTHYIRMYSAFGVCTGSWSVRGNSTSSDYFYTLDWINSANNTCTRNSN